MKVLKRLLCLSLCLLLGGVMLTGCSDTDQPDSSGSSGSANEDAIDIRLAVSRGAVAFGAVNLWNNQDESTAKNNYTVTLTDEADAADKLSKGDVDVAVVSTDAAASLYAQTEGGVQVLAVSNLGGLYILENGSTVKSVTDLTGKTIYATGKGTSAEQVLRYILQENGLDPDKDVTITFVAGSDELATAITGGTAAVAMVAEPQVTALKTTKPTLRTALNLTDEWAAVAEENSQLMMGCVVADKDFVAANADGIATFLQEYEASVMRGDAMREETAALCVKYGVADNEPIAANAIVGCGLTYVAGNKMKTQLAGYLEVLYDADAALVGGKLPDDDFYYLGQGDAA